MKSKILKNDFSKLNRFVKDFATDMNVRVGVLRRKSSRTQGPAGSDNAALGLIHEKGSETRGIPARSWLLMPIRKNSKKILAATTKGAEQLLAEGRKKEVLKRMGIEAERNIMQAFETSGFGTWPPLKDPTRRGKNKKGGGHPLVDTGQLKRSVSSDVEAR